MNSLVIIGLLALVIFITLVYLLRKRKGLILLLFLVAGLVAWFGYKEYIRGNQDLTRVTADETITVKNLVREFDENDSAANKKYLGRIVEVTGTVKEVTKDESGYYTVVLAEAGSLSSVRCLIDSMHREDAANLRAGSSATVRGACIGYNADDMGLGADVKLNRAVIITKKDP